jgi:guanylate kinase
VVNHNIEESVTQVRAILTAERLKRQRQVGLPEFVKGLREGQ